MLRTLPLLLALAVSLFALSPQYQLGVEDAAVALPEENVNTLWPINKENKRLRWNDAGDKILVVSWKSKESYEKYIKPATATSTNPDYVIWVTAAPQVRRFCKQFVESAGADQAALELRLKQYLGLNPDWEYDLFVEMWVDPADLFRPCPDPEIDDKQCNLSFGDTLPTVKDIPDYRAFFDHLYTNSFRSAPGVPWTGLGYTFDWGNPVTDVGGSEYIIVPGGSYTVHRAVPTKTYCKP